MLMVTNYSKHQSIGSVEGFATVAPGCAASDCLDDPMYAATEGAPSANIL